RQALPGPAARDRKQRGGDTSLTEDSIPPFRVPDDRGPSEVTAEIRSVAHLPGQAGLLPHRRAGRHLRADERPDLRRATPPGPPPALRPAPGDRRCAGELGSAQRTDAGPEDP